MANKTEYIVDNADILVDFLWNDVPLNVLEEAVQKMVDEGMIKVHGPNMRDSEKRHKKSAC